jgi:DDE superfamily endonuclease
MAGPPEIKTISDRTAPEGYSYCSATQEKSLQLHLLPVNLKADFFTASLALDSTVRAGTQSALSTGTAGDKRVLACRRTYLRVAGKCTYLYRAADSTGDTIDFLLSPKRDASAAKRFYQRALRALNYPRPRVINVDGNPAYPKVIDELKETRELGRRCRCRPVRYLNNVVSRITGQSNAG